MFLVITKCVSPMYTSLARHTNRVSDIRGDRTGTVPELRYGANRCTGPYRIGNVFDTIRVSCNSCRVIMVENITNVFATGCKALALVQTATCPNIPTHDIVL